MGHSWLPTAQNYGYVDQVGFYIWDKRIWRKKTDADIRQYADTAYGNQHSTSHRCTAVCNLLKARAKRTVEFDRQPVVTFTNGTLELETGIFRDFSQEDYCSISMTYPYDPDAKCPQWNEFIHAITDGDKQKMNVLQSITGYVLFPDCRFQKIFALIGDGGNGKSVYLEILQKLFGEANCSNIEPDKLAYEFYPIHLKDSLLNLGTEIDADFSKAEKMLKQISAGEEIMGCYKGMTHVKFYPRCKLVYACNEMPRASVVKGMDRRMVFINFPCRFVENPDPSEPLQKKRDIHIIPKLRTELTGIFNWVYAGYKELMEAGAFPTTEEQKEQLQQFREISNPIMVFCEEHVFSGEMAKDNVYRMYADWCQSTGHKALSREGFFRKFRDCMGKRIAGFRRPRIQGGKRVMTVVFAEEQEFTEVDCDTPFDK